MQYQEINTESIRKLMDIFYTKVRIDKTGLGDVFNKKIGTSDQEWEEHKTKIADFWRGLLLGEGDYKGQPMQAHINLPPFPQSFFTTWLELFEESLDKVYQPECSKAILQKAQMIAQRFQHMLYTIPHKKAGNP